MTVFELAIILPMLELTRPTLDFPFTVCALNQNPNPNQYVSQLPLTPNLLL